MRNTTLSSTLQVFLMFLVALFASGANALAEETLYKTLTFSKETNEKGISSYTETWTATIDKFTRSIANFNNYSGEDIEQLTNEIMVTAGQFAKRKGLVFA